MPQKNFTKIKNANNRVDELYNIWLGVRDDFRTFL